MIIQGKAPIYGKNLNGKIDSLVGSICESPIHYTNIMCSCISQKWGDSCETNPLSSRCF